MLFSCCQNSVRFTLTGFVSVCDDHAPKRKLTVDTPSSFKEIASIPVTIDGESESGDCKKDCGNCMVGTFSPLHLVSVWIDPSIKSKCVSVAILLPSGVGPGGYSTRVREGGRELELTVRWPSPMNSVHHLHRVWLRADSDAMEVYHPKVLGFDNSLKGLRESKSDTVESVAHIALPFEVDTHVVKKTPLGWTDSAARVIYVDMKACKELYDNGDENADFKIA